MTIKAMSLGAAYSFIGVIPLSSLVHVTQCSVQRTYLYTSIHVARR